LSDDNKQMQIVEELLKDVKLKWFITEQHIDTQKQHFNHVLKTKRI
jgi:hypothetical protein